MRTATNDNDSIPLFLNHNSYANEFQDLQIDLFFNARETKLYNCQPPALHHSPIRFYIKQYNLSTRNSNIIFIFKLKQIMKEQIFYSNVKYFKIPLKPMTH